MVVMQLEPSGIPVQTEGLERPEKPVAPKGGKGETGNAPSGDTIAISDEARAKVESLRGDALQKDRGDDESKDQSVTLTMGGSNQKSGEADKEKAVEELEDTDSDIKKKKDEIQEAKTTFVGSEEERERKIKELKLDLSDLEDTKKDLQSQLSA